MLVTCCLSYELRSEQDCSRIGHWVGEPEGKQRDSQRARRGGERHSPAQQLPYSILADLGSASFRSLGEAPW